MNEYVYRMLDQPLLLKDYGVAGVEELCEVIVAMVVGQDVNGRVTRSADGNAGGEALQESPEDVQVKKTREVFRTGGSYDELASTVAVAPSCRVFLARSPDEVADRFLEMGESVRSGSFADWYIDAVDGRLLFTLRHAPFA